MILIRVGNQRMLPFRVWYDVGVTSCRHTGDPIEPTPYSSPSARKLLANPTAYLILQHSGAFHLSYEVTRFMLGGKGAVSDACDQLLRTDDGRETGYYEDEMT